MDRFDQQMSQIQSQIARLQIAPALLMLGMLPGVALFTHLGAQLMTGLFAALAVSMLLLAAALPSIWAQRRSAIISAALLAYACGTHAVIFWLALPADHATLFDKLAGVIILALGLLGALGHTAWRALRRR
jgi:hypothetical protein